MSFHVVSISFKPICLNYFPKIFYKSVYMHFFCNWYIFPYALSAADYTTLSQPESSTVLPEVSCLFQCGLSPFVLCSGKQFWSIMPDKSCSNDIAVPAKRNKKELSQEISNACFIVALHICKETETKVPWAIETHGSPSTLWKTS